MEQTELTFATIEFTGYGQKVKEQKLSHIFNQDQMFEIEQAVGKSIYFTQVFTELVKGKSESETLTDLLKLQDPAFLRLKTEFRHRLQKLHSHPKLGELVDNNLIDFTLMQALEQLTRYRYNSFQVDNNYARTELIVSPLFEALFDNNIIWKSKYYDNFHVEHFLWIEVIEQWLQEKKAEMGWKDKLMYWKYKRTSNDTIWLGGRFGGVRTTRTKDLEPKHASKVSPMFEMAEIYYDIPAHKDVIKNWF